MEILHFRGQTGAFLEPSPGTASLNLLKMARNGLKLELRTAINQARRSGNTIAKEGLQIKSGDKVREITIEVTPIKSSSPKQHYYLVLFKDQQAVVTVQPAHATKLDRKQLSDRDNEIQLLRQELADTKEYLQRNIEEQDAYNEELKSANEEIQSSNEELQSTNEELETAKEELQSINEELTTLNDELQIRNLELSQVNNDLGNLLANVNFSVIMVGIDLRIRRFNPMAEKVLNIIPTDVGRPIGDIKPNVNIDNFEYLIAEVIDTLHVIEREVQDRSGHWYTVSIRPYKTSENKIDGAVIILLDSDPLKKSVESGARFQQFASVLFDTIQSPMLILTNDLHVEQANRAFYKYFKVKREELEGNLLFGTDGSQWDIPALKRRLEALQASESGTTQETVTHSFDYIGEQTLTLRMRRVSPDDNRIVLSIEGSN